MMMGNSEEFKAVLEPITMVQNQGCLLFLAACCCLALAQFSDEDSLFELKYKPTVMVNGIETDEPKEVGADKKHEEILKRSRKVVEGRSRPKRYMIKDLWTYGFIPYDMRQITASVQKEIRQAIAEIELNTCIRFHDINSGSYDTTKHGTYLRFIDDSGCWSDVGMVKVGPQDISPCSGRTWILHEVFHAIGVLHEQNHPKRDNYLTVLWNNIVPDQSFNFYHTPKKGKTYLYSEPNLNSVMMYDGLGFSRNGGRSMVHYYPRLMKSIDDPSLVWAEINQLYTCADRLKPNHNLACLNGGYPGVYNNVVRCICPAGYDYNTNCKTPVSRAHGGKFILNKSNREKSFDTTAIPSTDFWMFDVQAENPKDKIQLVFETFTVPCNKSVAIVKAHRSLYQGIPYCGSGFQHNPVSLLNSISLLFLPKRDTTAHIKGVFRLLPADEWCYNSNDKGYTYDGSVNMAHDFSACLNWTEVYKKCPRYAPNINIYDTNTNYQGNSCRNVRGDFPSPMCITEANYKRGCIVKLCDVCGYGGVYDKATDCAQLIQSRAGFCTTRHAQESCRKSCNLSFKDTTSRTCGPPSDLAGGRLTYAKQAVYNVGDYVEYQCDSDPTLSLYPDCLSTGHWVPMESVCSVAGSTTVCGDQSRFCPLALTLEPRMCSNMTLGYWKYCGKTCGRCSSTGTVPTCTIQSPPVGSNTVIVGSSRTYSAGQPIQYACKAGTVRESGDVYKACHVDGTVTGDQLICKDPAKIGYWVVDVPLKRGVDLMNFVQLFGPSILSNISKAGYIQRWKAYCSCDGNMILMALRKTTTTNALQVLGYDVMSCKAGIVSTLEVTGKRSRVEVNDFFGVSAPCMSLSYCVHSDHDSYYSYTSQFSSTVTAGYVLTSPNTPTCFDFPVDAYVSSIRVSLLTNSSLTLSLSKGR